MHIRSLMRGALLAGLALAGGTSAWAADIKVAPGSDGLRRAVSSAQAGDRLILASGVHQGPVVLDKALTLDLEHFEDSEFYDKLTRARREASSRPSGRSIRPASASGPPSTTAQ